MPQFYTVEEVIKTLRISRPTVSRKIKTGEIPAIHIGSRVLIPVIWVEQLTARAMGISAKAPEVSALESVGVR